MDTTRSQRGRRQLVVMYAVSLLVVLGRLLVFKWSPEIFDEENFGLYVVGMRGFSLAFLGLAPALVSGITYQVARWSSGDKTSQSDGQYLIAAYLWSLVLLAPLLGLGLAAPETLSKWALGTARHGDLMLSLIGCLVGQYVVVIPVAFLMGKTHLDTANLLGFLSSFLVPVGCLLLEPESALEVFQIMAWCLLVLGVVVNLALWVLGVEDRSWRGMPSMRGQARDLYGYALPRLPAAAGLAFLLAQPMLVPVQRTEELMVAAIFGAGGTLLGLANSMVQPLARVILPHATQLVAEGRAAEVRSRSLKLLAALLAATLSLSGLGAALTPWLLTAWLGPEAVQHAGLWLGLLPAIAPIAVYTAFSSLLNAAHPRPYDSFHVMVALAVFFVALQVLTSPGWIVGLLVAFNLSVWLLGILTVWRTLTVLRPNPR